MALEISQKAKELIDALRHGEHIDGMTKKWLSLRTNPPRIPVFYALTKIYEPNPVGRLSYQAANALKNESEVFEFPILTSRSPVWLVYTFKHHQVCG